MELDAYSRLLPGKRVVLQGLSAAELNGLTGRLESFHADRGRWAVCLGNTRKLLKPDNLQVVGGAFQGNVVTDVLSEDLFFRVCLFLPAPALLAFSGTSKITRYYVVGSSECYLLWRSLCYEMLGECLISLHITAWADGHTDEVQQDRGFWKILFVSAYGCPRFYYDHQLRERCMHGSDFFRKALVPKETHPYEGGMMIVHSGGFERHKRETLSASGHTACALGTRVYMIGGWRPWATEEDLHVCVVDFRGSSIKEPALADDSDRPERRLRHSSCIVQTASGEQAILVLGGCNDRTHDPCDGLQTLLLLQMDPIDTTKLSWKKLSAGGQMPKAIWHHTADSFASGRHVVVFGGDIPTRDPEFTYIGDRAYANFVYVLTMETQQWARVQTDGHVPGWRSLHAAVTFTSFEHNCEQLVMVGGCEDRVEIFNAGKPAKMIAYALNLRTMKWRRGLERKKQNDAHAVFLPAPRMRFAAQRYGRHLLVYGGHGNGTIPEDEGLLLLNSNSLVWQRATVLNEASEFGVVPAAALAAGCVIGGVQLRSSRGAQPVPKLDMLILAALAEPGAAGAGLNPEWPKLTGSVGKKSWGGDSDRGLTYHVSERFCSLGTCRSPMPPWGVDSCASTFACWSSCLQKAQLPIGLGSADTSSARNRSEGDAVESPQECRYQLFTSWTLNMIRMPRCQTFCRFCSNDSPACPKCRCCSALNTSETLTTFCGFALLRQLTGAGLPAPPRGAGPVRFLVYQPGRGCSAASLQKLRHLRPLPPPRKSLPGLCALLP